MVRRQAQTWAAVERLDCDLCGVAMPFEVPPCTDGHGEDCPDRVCVGCGLVLVVAPVPLPARRATTRTASARTA